MQRENGFLCAAVLVLGLAGGCASCDEQSAEVPAAEQPEGFQAQSPAELRSSVSDLFDPVPERVEVVHEKMALGRRLYFDPQLSGDATISCATCHSMDHGGAEPRATSVGIGQQVGPINSPTVLNAAFNFKQFWDGRAADLREQAAGPVTNPIEMGGDWPQIFERLNADEAYGREFQAVYGDDGIRQENVIDAIVEYESSLVTPSPFDAFLRGDDEAMSAQALRGLQRFVETGCTTCHRGRNLGGDSFQKMGLVQSYFELRGGEITEADLGRYNVTRDEADRHHFKVPTLRNVALTSPYFHDGSHEDLPSAVRTMARVQLAKELSDEEVEDIVAFLEALTGELPAHARLPESPEPGSAPEGTTAL